MWVLLWRFWKFCNLCLSSQVSRQNYHCENFQPLNVCSQCICGAQSGSCWFSLIIFFGFYEYIFRVLSKMRIYVVYFLFCKICFGYSYFEWFVFWLSTTDEVMAAKLLCSDIFVQSTCNISIQDVQLTVTVPAHFPVKHVRSMNIFHKLNIGNYIRVAPVR